MIQNKMLLDSPHQLPRTARFTSGPLSLAQERNRTGRLASFVRSEDSDPIRLFAPENRESCFTGDWYGEHAGKWLVAASAAAMSTSDPEIEAAVRKVTRFLVAAQEESGYLGTYSKQCSSRLSNPDIDGARTWDVWTHAWMTMGLLSASRIPGCEAAVPAAAKIGELLVSNFLGQNRSILGYGNHQGLSSAVVIEPLARLSIALDDPRFFTLAWQVLQELEDAGCCFLTGAEKQLDVSQLGTGKIYQICWILTGMTVLHTIAPELPILENVTHFWNNIRAEHLTPLGGPWGGIATHKEVFNPKGFFSPSGLVETCSIASWMALNRELYLLLDESKFVDEYERALLNSLVGAQDENGMDWCYFTFPNGRRNNTYYWACCKSSGAMALEQSSLMMASSLGHCLSINLIESGEADFEQARVVQNTENSSTGVRSTIRVRSDMHSCLRVRVPRWAELKSASINGREVEVLAAQENFLSIEIELGVETTVIVEFQCQPVIHRFAESLDHHGQEIVKTDYVHFSWGPYVYATGLIEGYKRSDTLVLPHFNAEKLLESQMCAGDPWPTLTLNQSAKEPIVFKPYYVAGGQHDRAWRTTWVTVAWQ